LKLAMVGELGGKAIELAHAHRRTVARCAVPKARGSCAANFLGDNLEWGLSKAFVV
jgi:hypothetical protein